MLALHGAQLAVRAREGWRLDGLARASAVSTPGGRRGYAHGMTLPDDLTRSRRTFPAGGTVTMLAMADGWPVRAALWPGAGKGSLLFIGGRGDFMEKYAEAIAGWHEAGWTVASFDWRGQGGSGRLGRTPAHGHLDSLEPLVSDMAELMDWFVASTPSPHHAVAHSMGGHLLVRHLASAPTSVRKAVLVAPMLGLKLAPLGAGVAALLARLMVALGRGGGFVSGAGPEVATSSVRQMRLTSDVGRYADEGWWTTERPELGIGGVTWGWLAAASASIAKLTPALLGRVSTPLLVFAAGRDVLVDNRAIARAVAAMPNAQMETMAEGAHELLRERDELRDEVLRKIDAWLR